MRRAAAVLTGLVGGLLATPGAPAQAEAPASGAPRRVRLVVTGDCPDEAALRAPLGARVLSPADPDAAAALRVEVWRVGDELHVRLVAPGDGEGHVLSSRTLPGHDCAALAGAIAAIVEAHDIELAAPAAPAEPVVESAPPVAPPVAPRAAEAPPRARLGLGLSGGVALDVSPDGEAAGAAAALDLSWRTPWNDLRLRGQLGVASAASPGAPLMGPASTRQPWSLRVDLGKRYDDGRLWWQPAGGVALVASLVEADGLGAAVRLHPAASLAVGVGLRLGEGVSLRVDGAALVFPWADRYWIDDQRIGSSPRTSLQLGLGLEVALGAKND